jgi:RNA polymerase sigma factor (sigma-70 family)
MPVRPPAKRLVERLIAEQYASLVAYFGRRVRRPADVADLAQETYLRLLRAPDPDSIRNPEGYLFTVARNLLREMAVLEGRQGQSIDLDLAQSEDALAFLPAFDADADSPRLQTRLREVLAQLSPKCRAAVMLQYQHGWTYQQIAQQLDVSPHMVKKYLAQGLAHCRRRMGSLA